MLAESQLKNLLAKSEFTSTDKLLLCLATENVTAKSVAKLRDLAIKNGLRAAGKWNVSLLLARSKGRAIRSNDGWELTDDGKNYVAGLVGPYAASPAPAVAASLRIHLSKIQNPDVRAFVEEGIECFEQRLYRSAVVLSWVGAVALLHQHVVQRHLAAFNAEATRRFANKWKVAATSDDLSLMTESNFLQVLESISVIGKNVKQELEKQLKLRNGCGHPNTLKISENIVAAHVELLILNVFVPFA